MGITKCRRRAKESVWWPTISNDIKKLVEDCSQCVEQRGQRAEPMKMTSLSRGPWLLLGIDIFEIAGQKYIVIQDYFYRFFEVVQLPNTTLTTIIARIKNILAHPYRLPVS
ncbi:hypothetical protein PR048_021508 [Dryococelus australis]|uniref:RNA-directed DNA polymerase n=1 Tax=Dryococelus australis TaxID=614101 RepID=A0ABQ9GYL2_9NEOP|nr:hypothetical protein PR048_021508 [Dryococelus australis]